MCRYGRIGSGLVIGDEAAVRGAGRCFSAALSVRGVSGSRLWQNFHQDVHRRGTGLCLFPRLQSVFQWVLRPMTLAITYVDLSNLPRFYWRVQERHTVQGSNSCLDFQTNVAHYYKYQLFLQYPFTFHSILIRNQAALDKVYIINTSNLSVDFLTFFR